MMDFEERLGRYRPIGTPSSLRNRVLTAASARQPGRRLQWLLPCSAAAAIVLFSTLASHERQKAALDPSTDERTRGSLVGLMTDAFNGDAQLARHAVSIDFVEEPVE